jgi:2-keto-4-pentenoate hydratase/2-oxohepta-3-ene-1,7-dioic acid hydratase in catechol pathway
VNGEKRQDSRTSSMIFDVGRLIASLTEGMTLLPGTVILTGTPAGVGMGNPDNLRFLKPGDTVRCEIERLGALENTVA